MSTYAPQLLSGSTDGLGIKVVATATLGTTIHTAVAGTDNIDEIRLYAVNTSAVASKLTIEWGTATAADGNIEQTIQPESGLELVIPRLRLQNGKVITAFAADANVILILGDVDRHTL